MRNKQCPMCGEVPSLVPSVGYGDGFTHPPAESDTQEHNMCKTL